MIEKTLEHGELSAGSIKELQDFWSRCAGCIRYGTIAGKYASQRFSASCASSAQGLAPPTECRPGIWPYFWPTDRKMPSRPEIWPVFWPTTKRMRPFRFTAEGHRAILT